MIEQHLDYYRLMFRLTMALLITKNILTSIGLNDRDAMNALDSLMAALSAKGELGITRLLASLPPGYERFREDSDYQAKVLVVFAGMVAPMRLSENFHAVLNLNNEKLAELHDDIIVNGTKKLSPVDCRGNAVHRTLCEIVSELIEGLVIQEAILEAEGEVTSDMKEHYDELREYLMSSPYGGVSPVA